MPKPITIPFIIDETKVLNISILKKCKYLSEDESRYGVMTWSVNGIESSSISISIKMKKTKGFLTLDYICSGVKYNYDVRIVSRTSNLGKGKIFYFVCPFTFMVCRKLHLYNERFIHRTAINSGMYSKQLHTKKWRQIEKVYGNYFDKSKHYEILRSKNFKKFYNGKPTKKYLMLMEKIKDGNKFSVYEINRILIFGC